MYSPSSSMLVALDVRVDGEEIAATEPDWAAWENGGKASFPAGPTVGSFLEPIIHPASPTSSYVRHLNVRSAQVFEERQDRSESQNGSLLSTTEILRPQSAIRRVFQIPLTATPPMMEDLCHQNDVLQDFDAPCEIFEIEQAAYCYDMVTKELPPFSRSPIKKTNERPFYDDNPVLQAMRRNIRNLVLDSASPYVAPHIVITPPTEGWDPFAISWKNQINLQSAHYLMVRQYSQLSPPDESSSFDQYYLESYPSEWDSPLLRPHRPKAVFNRIKFTQSIERSSTERLIMYHVTTALQKHLRKASAFAASIIAQSFRRRYDCPDFVRSLEKPFRWSDPAEPLLLASSRLSGTTIIDSVCPLTVPHIVISEAPPQSPWIAWNNATNDPQDCGHGAYLTVPSRRVSFINPWPDDDDDNDDDVDGAVDLEECLSPLDSPAPDTPTFDSGHEGKPCFLGCPGYAGVLISACGKEAGHRSTCSMRPSCDIFAGDDDDDDDDDGDDGDDLPPFDDWYLIIEERTKNRL